MTKFNNSIKFSVNLKEYIIFKQRKTITIIKITQQHNIRNRLKKGKTLKKNTNKKTQHITNHAKRKTKTNDMKKEELIT